MIDFKIIDPKTIEFDGEKFVMLEEYKTYAVNYINNDDILIVSVTNVVERIDFTINNDVATFGRYTQESWGFWRFTPFGRKYNKNVVSVILFDDVVGSHHVRYGIFHRPEIVEIASKIHNLRKTLGRSGMNLDGTFYYVDINKLPKWLKYITDEPFDIKHKYKLGSPFPHATLNCLQREFGGNVLMFFNKKAAERYKREMNL